LSSPYSSSPPLSVPFGVIPHDWSARRWLLGRQLVVPPCFPTPNSVLSLGVFPGYGECIFRSFVLFMLAMQSAIRLLIFFPFCSLRILSSSPGKWGVKCIFVAMFRFASFLLFSFSRVPLFDTRSQATSSWSQCAEKFLRPYHSPDFSPSPLLSPPLLTVHTSGPQPKHDCDCTFCN